MSFNLSYYTTIGQIFAIKMRHSTYIFSLNSSGGQDMSGSWCESFLEIFMSIIAFKVLHSDPFLDNGPLDRLLSSFSFWIGVASLLIFNDNFSDEGDLHILFRDWNAMLSGSRGPAVPLNIFPRIKFEKKTFEPVNEIQKIFRPKYFFWSIKKMTSKKNIAI